MLPILITNHSESTRVLIVGAGKVAKRRAEWILCSGINKIDIIAPELNDDFSNIIAKVNHICSKYQKQDLSKYNFVLACTNDREVNIKVGIDARKSNTLVNLADAPESSDFIVPSTINIGELSIAISTGTPSYTKRLKKDILALLPPDIGEYTQTLKTIRNTLKLSSIPREKMKEVLQVLSRPENFEHLTEFSTLKKESDIESKALILYNKLK